MKAMPKQIIPALKFLMCIVLVLCTSCHNVESDDTDSTKVIIAGKFDNSTSKSMPFAYQVLGVSSAKQESIPIDEEGNFYFSFNITAPVDAMLSIKRTAVPLNIHPGDRIYVTLDAAKSNLNPKVETNNSFSDRSNIHQEFLNFYQLLVDHPLLGSTLNMRSTEKLSGELYLSFLDSLEIQGSELLAYYQNTQSPSEHALTSASYFLQAIYCRMTSWYPLYVVNSKEWKVPEHYWDRLELSINTEDLDYPFYVEECVNAYIGFARIEIYKEGSAYSKYRKRFNGKKVPSGAYYSFFINWTTKHVKDDMMRQLMLCLHFSPLSSPYNKNTKPFLAYRKALHQHVTDPYLTGVLEGFYADILADKKREIEDPHNLNNSKSYMDIKSDSLVSKIMKDHESQYVLINCWSPWMGSTTNFLQDTEEWQKRLKKGNIGVVDMCMDASTGDWKAMLKSTRLKGAHYLLNEEQKDSFWDYAELKSLPCRILLNPEGKVIAKSMKGDMGEFYKNQIMKFTLPQSPGDDIINSEVTEKRTLSLNKLERNHVIALDYIAMVKEQSLPLYFDRHWIDFIRPYRDYNDELIQLRNEVTQASNQRRKFDLTLSESITDLKKQKLHSDLTLATYYSALDSIRILYPEEKRLALVSEHEDIRDSFRIKTLEVMIDVYHKEEKIFPISKFPYYRLMAIETRYRDEMVSESLTY